MLRIIMPARRRVLRWTLVAIGLLLLLPLGGVLAAPAAPPAGFADGAFQSIWERTDAPVLTGQVRRSWYWGPAPGQTLSEPYSGSKSGMRTVQYFDKARMEINNPAADKSSDWYVTTGLLVVEMVSGKQQIGDKEFNSRKPAEIAVAGDGLSADPDAPTYGSFRPVSSLAGPGANRAPRMTGQAVTATISRSGQVGGSAALGLYVGAKLAAYSDATGHNIPQAMWDFLNLKGTVQQNGAAVPNQALANWVFVAGYPITEPYWARVKIGGVYNDVLVQLYERRSLVYVPAFDKGWQVQMGNVGQHYYRWIYGGPLPVSLVPVSSPVPSGAAVSPAPPVPQVPPSIDAVVDTPIAEQGTTLDVSLSGFRPGEDIVSWLTAPDASARDALLNLKAGLDGKASGVQVPTKGLATGLWALTFHGKGSNHESVVYFYLVAPSAKPSATATKTAAPASRTVQPTSPATSQAASSTATPTRARTATPRPPQGTVTPQPTLPVVGTEEPAGLLMSVRPGYGPPDGQFTFSAANLTPGETVHVKFTDPTGATIYPSGSNNGLYTADATGKLGITLVPIQAFPSAPLGPWLFEADASQSGQQGVVGWTIR